MPMRLRRKLRARRVKRARAAKKTWKPYRERMKGTFKTFVKQEFILAKDYNSTVGNANAYTAYGTHYNGSGGAATDNTNNWTVLSFPVNNLLDPLGKGYSDMTVAGAGMNKVAREYDAAVCIGS